MVDNVNNSGEYVYNAYRSNDVVEEMSPERKAYLLEKEEMIRKRKKKGKIISRIILIIFIVVIGFYLYKNYFRPVKIDPRIDKNSIHYVTDLYYSDGRFYEDYLDEKEKKVYLTVFNDLKDINKTTEIDCRVYDYDDALGCATSINKIIDIVLMDHPDLFWYRFSDWSYDEGVGIKMNHHYVSTNKIRLYFVERRLLRKIDEISSKFENANDYDKVKGVYTWLGETTKYSTIITRKSGTAWSALLDNDSVCAGFAAASQLLFQRLGIESLVVVGSYDGEGHAWNFIELDDEYYWYDSTVAGSSSKDSSYFYQGLLFLNNKKYSVDVLNLDNYTFGTKYLES